MTVIRKEGAINASTSSSSTQKKRKTKPTKTTIQTPPEQEKQSVCKDYSKEDEPVKKSNKKKGVGKCPCLINHKKKELTGLSEEQIPSNLEKGYLLGSTCSVCNKSIVNKTKLTDKESESETVFNRKCLLLVCDNFKAANDIFCSFCMCHQCYVDISLKDEKDEGTNRRSRRNN